MKRHLPILLPTLVVAFALGCGGGNIGDLFSAFPPEAFEGGGGGGGGGGGDNFVAGEVAAVAGSQGVDGDVKNIALAQLADDRTIAFLAAGTSGVHVVDVSSPELLTQTDVITTLDAGVLTAPAAIAGGRVDAVTVVDNRFLVCVAIGSGAVNAVTVFDIDILIEDAVSTTADVSRAFIPPAAGSAIPAPGNARGNGGGVSGANLVFFVAGGGPTLFAADIDPVAAEWSARAAALPLTATTADTINVVVNQQIAIYVSVETTTGGFAVVALGHPDFVPAPPVSLPISGQFDRLLEQVVVGPGNMPLDLTLDGLSLYVTGEDSIFVFAVTNPVGPTLLNEIENTGEDTIGIAASGQTIAAAVGDAAQLFSGFGGQFQRANAFSFPGTFVVRSLVFHSTVRGQFLLVCAGDRGGLRVIQLTNIAP